MHIVTETLDVIGAKQKRLFVFNKIDSCSEERVMELKMFAAAEGFEPEFVSAWSGVGLEGLKKRIATDL